MTDGRNSLSVPTGASMSFEKIEWVLPSMRKIPRHVECCAVLGPRSQGETAFSPSRLLIGVSRKSNSCLHAKFVRIVRRVSLRQHGARSTLAASVKAFHEMIVTGRQRIYLVKAAGSVAKGSTLLAMELLEVQINLS
jgi:hypothetical protein